MNEQVSLPESELIHRICEGDINLFEVLVRRYNPLLYKIGRSYGFNHQDVEDLMQDAFVAAYRGLNGFENRASFKTWLARIMLNECYRKANKISNKKMISMENPAIYGDQADREDAVLNRELNRMVASALLEIPVQMRMVFSLREMSGLSTSETAAVMGITESNVKVRLNRTKQMLREKIEKLYTPAEIFDFNLKYCDGMVNRVMEQIRKPA